ncbi:MAG: hypothetical protein NTZ16_05310 [Verrucomicrobia bacterium]|nr:hypothetical protein [Verrucomicrobiota bacterium]
MIKTASLLVAAAFLATACSKQESTPAPAANPAPAPAPVIATPPVVTNAPAAAAKTAGILAPEEARKHVGEVAVVKGKVSGVHVSKKGDVFINFGASHPNSPFTAVCFQGVIPAAKLQALNGQTVAVRGKIKEYNGQVEIILETEDQILP